MGRNVRSPGPKIVGLIDLHDEHPEGFEAALIERGLRWRDVGSRRFTWGDCWAVISTLPWDAPLNRQANEHWAWGNPLHELVAIVAEATHNRNLYAGAQMKVRKSDLLRVPRPGDKQKTETKLGGDSVPLGELVVFLGDGWGDLF